MANKLTIKEIAGRAGVSPATVDRVVNNRGKVHARTVALVQDIIDNAGREEKAADMQRRAIRLRLIVHAGPNDFLDAFADNLIKKTGAASRALEVQLVRVAIGDPQGLACAIDDAKDAFDALGFMPVDHPAVHEAVARVQASGKPVVSLLAGLTGMGSVPFVGQNNRAAGRTAGLMLSRFLMGRVGQIGVIIGNSWFNGHEDRERGFRSILREELPEVDVLAARESNDIETRTRQITEELLELPDVVGLYNIGGCTDAVVETLRESDRRDLVVVQHDLTAVTRQALVDGVLSAIIHQDAEGSAADVISLLSSNIDQPGMAARSVQTPIVIFTRENLPPLATGHVFNAH